MEDGSDDEVEQPVLLRKASQHATVIERYYKQYYATGMHLLLSSTRRAHMYWLALGFNPPCIDAGYT